MMWNPAIIFSCFFITCHCQNSKEMDSGTIRLLGQNSTDVNSVMGIVAVYENNSWHGIGACSVPMENNSRLSTIICNSLNMTGLSGMFLLSNAPHGFSYQIPESFAVTDELSTYKCNGNETNLLHCPKNSCHNCNSSCFSPANTLGVFCNTNYCAPNPCSKFGRCENLRNGSFTCHCYGTSGPFCDLDIDECAGSFPCHKKKRCVNEFGSFGCVNRLPDLCSVLNESVPNGQIKIMEKGTSHIAMYSCFPGFVVRGSAILHCHNHTRSWDGVPPVCVRAEISTTRPAISVAEGATIPMTKFPIGSIAVASMTTELPSVIEHLKHHLWWSGTLLHKSLPGNIKSFMKIFHLPIVYGPGLSIDFYSENGTKMGTANGAVFANGTVVLQNVTLGDLQAESISGKLDLSSDTFTAVMPSVGVTLLLKPLNSSPFLEHLTSRGVVSKTSVDSKNLVTPSATPAAAMPSAATTPAATPPAATPPAATPPAATPPAATPPAATPPAAPYSYPASSAPIPASSTAAPATPAYVLSSETIISSTTESMPIRGSSTASVTLSTLPWKILSPQVFENQWWTGNFSSAVPLHWMEVRKKPSNISQKLIVNFFDREEHFLFDARGKVSSVGRCSLMGTDSEGKVWKLSGQFAGANVSSYRGLLIVNNDSRVPKVTFVFEESEVVPKKASRFFPPNEKNENHGSSPGSLSALRIGLPLLVLVLVFSSVAVFYVCRRRRRMPATPKTATSFTNPVYQKDKEEVTF